MAERNENASWAHLFRLLEVWLLDEAFSHEGARDRCEGSIALAAGSDLTVGRVMGLALHGRTWLGLGRTAEAAVCFEKSAALARREPVVMGWVWQILSRLGLAECALRSGSFTRACEQAGRALELASGPGEITYAARARALRAVSLLQTGAVDAAGEEIRLALEAIQGREAPLAEWRVFETAAAVARARGEPAASAEAESWAAGALRRLASTLDGDEDLRRSFLAHPRVIALLQAGGPGPINRPRSASRPPHLPAST